MNFYEKIKRSIFGNAVTTKKINFVAEGYSEKGGKPEQHKDNHMVDSDHDTECDSSVESVAVTPSLKYNFVAKNYDYPQPLKPMKQYWFNGWDLQKTYTFDRYDLFDPSNHNRHKDDDF